jgi:predicted DNA-binding transcriptional regulator AlpA
MKRTTARQEEKMPMLPRDGLTAEEIMTLDEVATILKMKRRSVYELTRERCRRPLPFFEAGKVLRFRRSEINLWATGAA